MPAIGTTLRTLATHALRLPAVAVAIAAWEFAARGFANPVILPTPLRVLEELVFLARTGDLATHAAASMRRLAIAFALAAVLGIATGAAMGLSRRAGALIDPLIELVRPISGIAWIPLGLYLFGIGDQLPIFVIAYVAFFPIVLNTAGGVAVGDSVLVRAARTMGVSPARILWTVILPGSLPSILTGLRLGAGGAWVALIAAELVGAPVGLGFAIQWYGSILDTPAMLALILAVSLLGFASDIALRLVQRALTPWAPGLTVAG